MKYRVAVRALCEFTAKQGDLDLRFTPSPSAREGIDGHLQVQRRRGQDYQAEVPLSGAFGPLEVRGRADGYDPARNQLEEIKTFRGDLERLPPNHRHLHWAQARIYGHLLCRERSLDGLWIALVYFDVVRQRETLVREWYGAGELDCFFRDQCRRFLDWAEREMAHRRLRNEALTELGFPHPRFRPGQRKLAEAVYKAAAVGRCLMAEAPTGIGKTLATLFPQLKAMPGQSLDKLFFLAAKTTGRQLALQALETLGAGDGRLPLRVVELTAREKACEYPENACHGDACPLARGFYDRLDAARQAAVDGRLLDRDGLRKVAREHEICPYYLSQELARWADLVVADYNYFFDLSGLLFSLTGEQGWRVGVMVDEAHNLVERARSMYTAELDQVAFRSIRRAAPAELKRPLNRLGRAWNALKRGQETAYQAYDQPPSTLMDAIQQCIGVMGDYFAEHPVAIGNELQRFYFDLNHFLRVGELFDQHFLFDVSLEDTAGQYAGAARLCIRNLVPAPALRDRFLGCHSAVLFSATLSPAGYYRDMLGLPDRTAWLSVDAPFDAEQLEARIIDGISTRYGDRPASLQPITDLMAAQYQKAPGNYLAFFSSFEYLDQVVNHLQTHYPTIPVWLQSPGMDESARRLFLDRFGADSRGIGFAVLGGAFAEGIDLPGRRLVGAFIATLGLPPVTPVNEAFRNRLQHLFGRGYDYAYLFPGIRKVVQAAGRVIRTQSDRGVLCLIDDRFARPGIRALMPGWWHPRIEAGTTGKPPAPGSDRTEMPGSPNEQLCFDDPGPYQLSVEP